MKLFSKLFSFVVSALLLAGLSGSSQASLHQYRTINLTSEPIYATRSFKRIKSRHYTRHTIRSVTRWRDRRPRKWCGWYMRHYLGVRSVSYNRAAQWIHYGHRVRSPRIGAVIVWRHHVGIIVGRSKSGLWIVHQGNHRNRIATVATSNRRIRQAIAFRVG